MSSFDVAWIDGMREPACPPDPAYPKGKDLDTTRGAERSCRVELPYPAKRCGYWRVRCLVCRQWLLVTTAGRPDDPRSLRLPCALGGSA